MLYVWYVHVVYGVGGCTQICHIWVVWHIWVSVYGGTRWGRNTVFGVCNCTSPVLPCFIGGFDPVFTGMYRVVYGWYRGMYGYALGGICMYTGIHR